MTALQKQKPEVDSTKLWKAHLGAHDQDMEKAHVGAPSPSIISGRHRVNAAKARHKTPHYPGGMKSLQPKPLREPPLYRIHPGGAGPSQPKTLKTDPRSTRSKTTSFAKVAQDRRSRNHSRRIPAPPEANAMAHM